MTQIDLMLPEEKKISITVPSFPDKFNYYYEPSNQLHQFDEATATFHDKNTTIELSKDVLQEIIGPLYTVLLRAKKNQLQTSENIPLGLLLNNTLQEETNEESKIFSFWVWSSSNHVATLLYNKNNQLYLEISPIYPWIFTERKPNENYQTFNQFIKNYQPYCLTTISQERIKEWMSQLKNIIEQTNSQYIGA